MSSKPKGPVTAFRLFYDDVLDDVRRDLIVRLGTQTVPLPELQREIGRLWKESPKQEEYRKRAASHQQPVTAVDDPVFPLYRIRRILDLDGEGPRVNKDTLRSLSKATGIFLSHMAARVHKHMLESESNYPVKPEHISHVINDPRYLMYQFLVCSQEELYQSDVRAEQTEASSTTDATLAVTATDVSSDIVASDVRAQGTTESIAKKRPCSILNYFR